ncbi:MAG: Ig-like domain-containing protein [Thermoguttaceae bacterium]
MFSDLFSQKGRTSPSGGLRRSRCLSVEPLEERRLLSAAALHAATASSKAVSLAPFVLAGHHAGATVTTKAATLSTQASTTTAAATTTTVAVSPSTSTYGEQVALTATVTTSGTGTLSGKVQFYDSGVAIGTARLNSSGQAVLNLNGLSVGDHSITATYLGNTNFSTSSSATAATLTVGAASTYTVVTTSGNPVAPGDTLTLIARVLGVPTANGNQGGGPGGGWGLCGDFGSRASLPTGTVDFTATDSSGTVTDLGSAEVTNGVAKLSTSSLAAGDYTITATFTSGDGNYTTSTSQAVTQSVSSTLSATAIHVSMSPRHGLAVGDAVTYTVTVKAKGSSSTTTPTGTVTFVDAVTGVALTGSPVTLTDGKATLSTTYTTDPIIVTYTPDSTTGSGSDTYASSQAILPLFGGRGHGGWGFGEGRFGGNPHDAALLSFINSFHGSSTVR